MNWTKPAIVFVGSVASASVLAWLVGYSPILTGGVAAILFIFMVGADFILSARSPDNPKLGYASVLRGSPLDGVKVLLGGLGCSIPLILAALFIAYLVSEFGG